MTPVRRRRNIRGSGDNALYAERRQPPPLPLERTQPFGRKLRAPEAALGLDERFRGTYRDDLKRRVCPSRLRCLPECINTRFFEPNSRDGNDGRARGSVHPNRFSSFLSYKNREFFRREDTFNARMDLNFRAVATEVRAFFVKSEKQSLA